MPPTLSGRRHFFGQAISRLSALPLNASAQLDESREVGLPGDMRKATGTDVQRTRTVEAGGVGYVDRFRTELQRDALPDLDALENRDVPVVLHGRPRAEGTRDVTECSAWGDRERCDVEVIIQLLLRSTRHVRVDAGCVRTLCGVAGSGVKRVERLDHRHREASGDGGNGVELPATD